MKMIHSLDLMGWTAEGYSLELIVIVFRMMDLEEHEKIDEIYHHYLELSRRMVTLNLQIMDSEITKLVYEAYEYLKHMRKGDVPIVRVG